MISNRYYSTFQGGTFVIQAEADAVEKAETTLAILHGIQDLLAHGIRVVFIFGKGARFEKELRASFGAREHAETNRLIIPETALSRIRQQRSSVADTLRELCRQNGVPARVLSESVVLAERRIGHDSTGVAIGFDTPAVQNALDCGDLAILGFGGVDQRGQFLQVPSISIASDLAVELQAQKLLLLTRDGGIFVPDRGGGRRPLSFADLEGLLCLLRRRDRNGRFVISDAVLPKVHASVRAVAGGVSQVHLVSYARLLDEILTRTGVGTMIERQQRHHVDYAQPEDLEEVVRLHAESQQYRSELGTPYVKPLDRSELTGLLPTTLVLKHRGIIIGKLHTLDIADDPKSLQLGGFVIGENHQDSQQGQLLLTEALARLRQRGYRRVVAITASQRAQTLFERIAGPRQSPVPWQASLLERAARRYDRDERDQVQLVEFRL